MCTNGQQLIPFKYGKMLITILLVGASEATTNGDGATNGAEPGGLKRKSTGDGQVPKKKKIKGPPLPKTPAVILNEIQPGM